MAPRDLATLKPINDPARTALRHRTRSRLLIGALLFLVAATAWRSHVRAGVDAEVFDGQKLTVDGVRPDCTLLLARTEAAPAKVRLRAVEPINAEAASRYLAARLRGKTVTLKVEGLGSAATDGTLLADVYLGESACLNLDLVRDGQAYFDRRVRSFLESSLEQAETNARTRKIGLWRDLRSSDMPQWRRDWLASRQKVYPLRK